MTYVILDADDADRLIRYLYHGRRPHRVHTLVCGCGAMADLRTSDAAWNGWQVLPSPCCPKCLPAYPGPARADFVERIRSGRES